MGRGHRLSSGFAIYRDGWRGGRGGTPVARSPIAWSIRALEEMQQLYSIFCVRLNEQTQEVK